MTEHDYEPTAPSADSLKRLAKLAADAKLATDRVALLEVRLKEETAALKAITEREIPDIMEEIGLTDFRLTDGTRIQIKEDIRCSVSADRRIAVKEYFDEHGLSGMVKRAISIEFNAGEEKWANKFEADLRKRKHEVRTKIDYIVHPSTLKAWVTRALEESKEIPLDLFGVFRQRRAKVD